MKGENTTPFGPALTNLNNLFNETCECVHSIKIRNVQQPSPFSPTQFMYMFFFFNTLYNIDWKKSIKSGNLTLCDEQSERKKIGKTIEFCFSDKSIYRNHDHFIDYLKGEIPNSVDTPKSALYSKNMILNKLERIKYDASKNGSLYKKNDNDRDYVAEYKESMRQLLNEDKFNEKNLKSIMNYIYDIRCNLFHGVKSFDEITKEEQQERLDIYTRTLMAMNDTIIKMAQKLWRERNRERSICSNS